MINLFEIILVNPSILILQLTNPIWAIRFKYPVLSSSLLSGDIFIFMSLKINTLSNVILVTSLMSK